METNRTNERSKKDFEKMVKGTVYLKDKKPGNPPLGRWLYSSNKKFSLYAIICLQYQRFGVSSKTVSIVKNKLRAYTVTDTGM